MLLRFLLACSELAAFFAKVVYAMLRGPAGRVHTNGCGDFTLLSKSAWADLRGYPEMPIWSMHLDSLLCYVAVAAGYKQRVLEPPAHMYHLEHASSWVTMDLDERLRTFAQRPWIDTSLLQQLHSSMSATGEPIIYNDEDWGLAGLALEEFDTAIAAEAPGGAVARS